MKAFLKYCLFFIGMIIAGFYIYQLVMSLSPGADLFAPMK